METQNYTIDSLSEAYLLNSQEILPIKEKLVLNDKLNEIFTKKMEIFLKSKDRIFLMALSGFSGVGKSTISESLFNVTREQNIPTEIIPNNLYLATESQTKDRRIKMTSSWKNFQKMFYNFEKLESLVRDICTQNPGNEIIAKNTYLRFKNGKPHGKLDGEETIKIPYEKFTLLLDGVNSIEYAQKLRNVPETELFKFFVLDDPAQSILRATFRNCIKKHIELDDTFERKLKEHFYMWIWMLQNINDADMIVFNKANDVLFKQIEKYCLMFQQETGEIKKKIQKITDDFGDSICKFPKKFSHFSFVLLERVNHIMEVIDS